MVTKEQIDNFEVIMKDMERRQKEEEKIYESPPLPTAISLGILKEEVEKRQYTLDELNEMSKPVEEEVKKLRTEQGLDDDTSTIKRLKKFSNLLFPFIEIAGVLGTTKANIAIRAKKLVGEDSMRRGQNIEIVRPRNSPSSSTGITSFGVLKLFSTAGTRGGFMMSRSEHLTGIAKGGNIDCRDYREQGVDVGAEVLKRMSHRGIITHELLIHYLNMREYRGKAGRMFQTEGVTWKPIFRQSEITRTLEIFNNVFYIFNIALINEGIQMRMDWEEMMVKFRIL